MAEMELTTASSELVHALRNALDEIFTRFDADKDEALCDAELDEFVKACNGGGDGFSAAEKEDMISAFQVNEKGQLTRTGFMQMYHLQTMAEPSETWNDLRALGYDDSLTLVKKEEEKEKEAEKEETEGKEEAE